MISAAVKPATYRSTPSMTSSCAASLPGTQCHRSSEKRYTSHVPGSARDCGHAQPDSRISGSMLSGSRELMRLHPRFRLWSRRQRQSVQGRGKSDQERSEQLGRRIRRDCMTEELRKPAASQRKTPFEIGITIINYDVNWCWPLHCGWYYPTVRWYRIRLAAAESACVNPGIHSRTGFKIWQHMKIQFSHDQQCLLASACRPILDLISLMVKHGCISLIRWRINRISYAILFRCCGIFLRFRKPNPSPVPSKTSSHVEGSGTGKISNSPKML